MPNVFAYFILIAFPLFALKLFQKKPPAEAVLLVLLSGMLLLPVGVTFDLPLYDLDKNAITSLAAFIGCVFVAKHKVFLVPQIGVERWMIFIYLFAPVVTVLNNLEPYGSNGGLGFYTLLVDIVNRCLNLIPFLLGLHLIKSHENHLMLFKFIVVSAIFYSVLILWEMRMSPHLHRFWFGFFPHDLKQQVRMGGFRATVFLGHGLTVAMFVTVALGAAAILWKENIKVLKIKPILCVAYLFVLVVFCKTVGALILGSLLVLILGFMPMGVIRISALVIALLVILYPLLCVFDLFPHQPIIDLIATNFGAERSESLSFRFFHEGNLMAHAQEKILFGWGRDGRMFVPGAIVDGVWIIWLASMGLVGFGVNFGLMLLAILKAAKASNVTTSVNVKRALLSHSFIVAVIMVDQIPNSSIGGMHVLIWFIVGALLSRSNNILSENQKA